MEDRNGLWRSKLFSLGLMSIQFLVLSCSMQASIPTVSDEPLEKLVRNEAARIIAVSEDKDHVADYRIYLSDFPRKDVLGMSVGGRRVYINHEMVKLASTHTPYLWLLRQTLAHEIAHETARHAHENGGKSLSRGPVAGSITSADIGLPRDVTVKNYSKKNELEADAKGLEYWKRVGWDCRIWVAILKNFEAQHYVGDALHPTDQRLRLAKAACPAETGQSEARGPGRPD